MTEHKKLGKAFAGGMGGPVCEHSLTFNYGHGLLSVTQRECGCVGATGGDRWAGLGGGRCREELTDEPEGRRPAHHPGPGLW